MLIGLSKCHSKVGTFTNLVRQAVNVCSEEEILKRELSYLEKVFVGINQYPHKVVKDVILKEFNRKKVNDIGFSCNEERNNTKQQEMQTTVQMSLPYVGIKGEIIVKRFKKDLRKKINIKRQVTYKAKKLASKFHVKDEIKLSNKHNNPGPLIHPL